MVARRRDGEMGARREAPHIGGASAAVAEEFYRNPVDAVRAGTDGGIGPHVRPPADLHRHIDVAAGLRNHEVPRRLDFEEPDVAGEIPRPEQLRIAPFELLGHRRTYSAAWLGT